MSVLKSNTRWRYCICLWCVVGVCAMAAGCHRTDDEVKSDEPVTVRLGYFPNVTHAQAILGMSSGDFAAAIAPAKIQGRVFNAGPSLVEALFAGEIDVAYIGPTPAIQAFSRSHGQALRLVGGAASNGVALVARPEARIRSIDDLRGKRVATPQLGNTQDVSARHFMAVISVGQRPVSIIPMSNAEQSAMLRRGEIDAAWTVEPWVSRLVIEQGASVVFQEDELWPGKSFAISVIIATPRFLERHPDIVQKILSVNHRWTHKLRDNPLECLGLLEQALVELNGRRLPAGVLARSLQQVRFDDRLDKLSIQTFADWCHELGYLRQPVSVDAMMDDTFAKQVSDSEKRDE